MLNKIIKMLMFVGTIMCNTLPTNTYDYLTNKNINADINEIGYDNTGFHNQWPYSGVGCIAHKKDEKHAYMISSQGLYFYGNQHNKCYRNRREITILKYNAELNKIDDYLLLGSYTNYNHLYTRYSCYGYTTDDYIYLDDNGHSNENKQHICEKKGNVWKYNSNNIVLHGCNCDCCKKINEYGGLGSDDIRTCGITDNNILFLVGGNYLECPQNYNTEPSIVRINLNDFTFMDRTLLKNINGMPVFDPTDNSGEKKYLNYPSDGLLDDNSNLHIIFNHEYTGLIEMNIKSTPISVISYFQKSYS